MANTEPDWLKAYPEDVQNSILRLGHDPRMHDLRGRFTQDDLWRVTMEYDQSIARDAWDNKTQQERDAWLEKFEKLADQFIKVMREGPRPPEKWGFPVRDNVLMNTIYRMGYELPDPANIQEFFSKMQDLESAADAEEWDLTDSIDHYRQQVRSDCEPQQILKKPGDRKAARAAFIVSMKAHSRLSNADIAIVASILFNDEAIDDRLVRRLTEPR